MFLFNKILDKYTPSFILPFGCYFFKYFNEFYLSKFYNPLNIIILFFIIFIIQLIAHKFNKSSSRFLFFLLLFFYCFFIVFIFGLNLVFIINKFQFLIFNQQLINGSIILISFLIIFLFLQFIFCKNKNIILLQNTIFGFLLFISLLSFFFNWTNTKKNVNLNEFNSISPLIVKHDIKPLIFIILDEYTSPQELYNFTNDSSFFHFGKYLKNYGWVIKNNFYSKETRTISSLTSLFNYNLDNLYNSKIESENIVDVDKLIFSRLGNSLLIKKVEIHNFGIFDIEKTKPLTRLYFYPYNFCELFLKYTVYPQLHYKTNGFKNISFNSNGSTIHNKLIFSRLADTLRISDVKKRFIYVHLFMPHAPYSHEPEFKTRNENLLNYIEYWKFTNNKITPILDSLIKLKKYHIIITGDHGYRGSKYVNPNNTFAAFYGFDDTSINNLKNVQDLGILINNNF
jgi:hypothetical protein